MVNEINAKSRSSRPTAWVTVMSVLAATGIAATGLAVASESAHASGSEVSAARVAAAITTPGYYSLKYSPDIWYFSGVGAPYHVSFAQWKAAGFPKPTLAATQYGQVPGDDGIWAQTQFGSGSAALLVSPLTLSAWSRAGWPKPTITDPNAAFARNVVQWSGSDEVFYASATQEGAWRKLTLAQWQALGSPAPLNMVDQAITKLPWSSTVSQMSSLAAGQGKALTFAEWSYLGAPTPTVVAHYAGQRFCTRGSDAVYYYGGGINGMKLTFQQWVAAGAPKPTTC